MGSFNTTCFVSQQTISTDDDVIVIPISQQTTYQPIELLMKNRSGTREISKFGYTSSTCYSTSFWSYAGPILRGTYDDYGQVVFSNTLENYKNLSFFFSELNLSILDTKEGENTSHDLALKFSDIYNPEKQYSFDELINIMNTLWEVASESRVFVRNWNGEPVNLAFSIMHASAGKYLVDSVSKGKTWSGDSLEIEPYFHTYLNKKLQENLEIFSDKKDISSIASFLATQLIGLEGYQVGNSEGSFIRKNYSFSDAPIDTLVNYLKGNPNFIEIPKSISLELFEQFKSQIEHRYIDEGLNNLNIRISPMVYATQDYDNTLGNEYLKMVKSVNQEINSNLSKRYGEDNIIEETIKIKPKV